MKKKSRQEKILELVAAHCIDTQDELIDRLRESGYDVTQATVSRDIRALNLINVQTEQGNYRYVQPHGQRRHADIGGSEKSTGGARHVHSILGVSYAMNNVVVKTPPGMASPVALFLDDMYHQMMLGCVAGDDTIIVVTRSEEDSRKLCDYLESAVE
jgi:transcriptional regulator of arginine metabolism